MKMIKTIVLTLCATGLLLAAAPNPKDQKECLDAIEAWKKAVIAKDKATLEKLTHPDVVYSHSKGGKPETRKEMIDAMLSPDVTYKSLATTIHSAQQFGKTMLLQGKIRVINVQKGVPSDLELSMLWVWINEGKGWQLSARQTTRIIP
jgi:ketosteroid isomerase-like protein